MADLCSNRPFCSIDLIISSEPKKSRWSTYIFLVCLKLSMPYFYDFDIITLFIWHRKSTWCPQTNVYFLAARKHFLPKHKIQADFLHFCLNSLPHSWRLRKSYSWGNLWKMELHLLGKYPVVFRDQFFSNKKGPLKNRAKYYKN